MTKKQDVFERYLLGDVTEDERAEVERSYFADDATFDELVDAQNDLVDDYAAGALPSAERKRFEERFLNSSAGIDRVEFARSLQKRIAARSRRKPVLHWQQFAIAASVAIVILAAAWIALRREPRVEQARPQARQQQPAPAAALVQTQAPAALVTVLLTPGTTRESEAKPPLVLRPAPQVVRVELVLANDRYDAYGAELQDVEGTVLWKAQSLHATAAKVTLDVPAKLLPPGDYVVALQGIRGGKASEIDNYTFTVVALPARR